MRKAGIILMTLGIIGLVIFSYRILNDPENFRLLGIIDVSMNRNNWLGMTGSAIIGIIGSLLYFLRTRK